MKSGEKKNGERRVFGPGDSVLYTIEGNRIPAVHGLVYFPSRMEKLLGYGHVPG